MINVAILGATGTVGQKFVSLLEGHPQFRIHELVASERSSGKTYKDACNWKQDHDIPKEYAQVKVLSLGAALESKILFSGLDSSVAFEAEQSYAEKGHIIISNSKNHRMEPMVPLVIPEVNYEHLHAIKFQSYRGAIITNPNCSTIGLVLALAPLHQKFGIKKIMVHTMQAISGAGYPGVASLDILANVVPHIQGEEEKLETETKKLFGTFDIDKGQENGQDKGQPKCKFQFAEMDISAHCNRVPVKDGHTESVSVACSTRPSREEIIDALRSYSSYPQAQKLYTAPEQVIHVYDEEDRPQAMLDIMKDKAMAVHVGRVRPCNILDFKFTVLCHNTVRGAAGAAILNAETLLALDII